MRLIFAPEGETFEIGDQVLAIYLALATTALRGSAPSPKTRFYHKTSWFLCAAAFGGAVNIAIATRNILLGCSLGGTLSFEAIHFPLVLIYSALTMGVIPHLVRDVKGKYLLASLGAIICLVIYVGTLWLDLTSG